MPSKFLPLLVASQLSAHQANKYSSLNISLQRSQLYTDNLLKQKASKVTFQAGTWDV